MLILRSAINNKIKQTFNKKNYKTKNTTWRKSG